MKKFLTKAGTLKQLIPVLQSATILPIICFTVKDWEKGRVNLFADKQKSWLNNSLIVRSSGLDEDAANNSLAGKFESVLNVKGKNEVACAVGTVIESFGSFKKPSNQIFIQPMLENVMSSGVAFTRDPNTGGHYYVINMDENSGKTDTVTSGTTNQLKTIILEKNNLTHKDENIKQLILLLQELEEIFGTSSVDVEFAFDRLGVLYLLQVRPLVIPKKTRISQEQQGIVLKAIQSKFLELNRPHPKLHGKKTVFGVMPDWNPGEIIGRRPRPLALSLYRELITDHIWAYQRDNYGYRNLRSFPLLVDFHGLPYIDVRISFNSFIPASVSDKLANKLVNHYIQQLCDIPSFHDKVEFKILHSCYTIDMKERLEPLLEAGFNQEELEELQTSLKELTNKIIHDQDGLWRKDTEKIDELAKRQKQILTSDLDDIGKIYWLIEDCKRYGTLPFAGLARAGFIAVQLIHSLVKSGIFQQSDHEQFMASLNTVSSGMAKDFKGKSQEEFLEKYGHLRPGTYDILSPTYQEDPNRYFDWNNADRIATPKGGYNNDFSLSLPQLNELKKALSEHGLEHEVLSLFDFLAGAIEGREYAKFVFTKSLSEALNLILIFGEKRGLSRDDLSYLNIDDIMSLYSASGDIDEILKRSIMEGKNRYAVSQMLSLPSLIVDVDDLSSFVLPLEDPNFITLKSSLGTVVNDKTPHDQLRGGIMMIKSADPGYDWIFSHDIAGFITMYGGMNSHMAIRAAELCVPAVIGAGEFFFNQWLKASLLEIDCSNKFVRILK